MRVCKVDGCDEPAAATRGVYALLCTEHAAERRAQANGHQEQVESLVVELLLDFDEQIETAIDQACTQFRASLRQRLQSGKP